MAQDYGYGNARLRAMRSRLLSEADYSALLAKTGIEEVITALTETPYRDDVEAALLRGSGVQSVLAAVRANLTRTLGQIRTFYEAEPRELVERMLRRWDQHNLMTILRGQRHETDPEEVLTSVVPVGQLDDVALRELARQPGLRACLDLMTIWRLPYANVLRSVPTRTAALPELDQLELALQRFHYASLQEGLNEGLSPGAANRALMLEQLQIEIDIKNLSISLRLARHPGIAQLVHRRYNASDMQPVLIEPGGYLATQQLARLVAEAGSLEGLVHGLRDTRYGPALAAGWKRYQADEGGIGVLERELERWQAERTAALFTRDPLGIAIPIGYVGCKEVERANLGLIAQAVALDLEREPVRRDLILV